MKTLTRRTFLSTASSLSAGALMASCAPSISIAVNHQFDIIIKNGTIIDGTGKDPYPSDVGIRDGKIVALERLETTDAGKIIDAAGLMVVPGFIDIHTHTDSSILSLPTADSKLRQGVTTEIGGADGESQAPRDLSGNEKYLYTDMAGFFSVLKQQGHAQNFASMVGLGTVREKVVGMENREATSDEIARMKKEVEIAIAQGCIGVSTGLEYTPGSFASTEELWQVTQAAPQPYRIYASHMRNEDNTLLEAIDEAITIARNSGARLQISHLKASYKVNWYKQELALRMLDEAIAQGIEVHADRYPYIAYQTGLANLFPLWSRAGGNQVFVERLKDKAILEKIRPETLRKISGLGSWDSVMIASVRNEANKMYMGKTIQQIVAVNGMDPFEFCVRLMLDENASVGMVGFGMDEEGTEMCLRWKNTIVSSDGGAYSLDSRSNPHPRTFGTFPRAIAYYQKERKICSLSEMIRKMTSMPAEKIGLKQRGIIHKNYAADIVLFNYETIRDAATFIEPKQFPIGIPYVIVNGIMAVDSNSITGKLPGEILTSSSTMV